MITRSERNTAMLAAGGVLAILALSWPATDEPVLHKAIAAGIVGLPILALVIFAALRRVSDGN